MARVLVICGWCLTFGAASAPASGVEIGAHGDVFSMTDPDVEKVVMTEMEKEPENDMLFKDDPEDVDEEDLLSVQPEHEDERGDPWIADGELMVSDEPMPEPHHRRTEMVRKEGKGASSASLSSGASDLDDLSMEETGQDVEHDSYAAMYGPEESNGGVTGAVPLNSRWRAYGGRWGTPTYMVKKGYCVLTGLVRSGHWGRIATLPGACRPSKRLIFNCNNHRRTSRCDVLPDGRVYYCGGGRSHGWLSLTGIRFHVGGHSPSLQLWNGWKSYGGSYGTATYSINKAMCSVEGLVKYGKYGRMAVLPRDCWPKKRMMFMVNNHQYATRVDVETNGVISWQAGGKSHRWISLSGIFFSTASAEGSTLPTRNGWVPIQGIWGAPSFTLNSGYCMVEGLVKGSRWGFTAHLPTECRPKKRLIFTLPNHKFNARVDVDTDGKIYWITGGHYYGWYSLSGILFDVPDISYKGLPGHRGLSGGRGAWGAKGNKGFQGPVGHLGEQGIPGLPGGNGSDGINGSKGIPGIPGGNGSHGDKGHSGPKGRSGFRGPPGDDGRPVEALEVVDCEWHAWMEWGDCSRSCGEGFEMRYRNVKQHAQDGGKMCGGTQTEERHCPILPCPEEIENNHAEEPPAMGEEHPLGAEPAMGEEHPLGAVPAIGEESPIMDEHDYARPAESLLATKGDPGEKLGARSGAHRDRALRLVFAVLGLSASWAVAV